MLPRRQPQRLGSMTAGRAWIFATLMIMMGLISILVIRVFMMMAMTNGHHEEFLRIDEILVIMMMALMVLMVMTCIMVIMLMEVMPAMTMIGMIIVMMFMMVIRLMMLVVVIAKMITLRTSQELTTSRSYAAPRRPCSHLLARRGSVFCVLPIFIHFVMFLL